MDHHIKEFYHQSADGSPSGNFHKVIPLHEAPEIDWTWVAKQAPQMCKGWFELAHISSRDRIDFTRDFWLTKMPYHAGLDDFVSRFFASLDDVGIFLTQQKFDDPFEPHLVYSIKGDNGFFSGSSPATEEQILELQKTFPGQMLPKDYLAFLQIHNGFCKTTDCTGIIRSAQMKGCYEQFQGMMAGQDPSIAGKTQTVNPKSLIPFYESFGMPFFQCFWTEWYPQEEMGNVYYSGLANTISPVTGSEPDPENMAFPTFTDWLIFYLERIES